MRAADTRVDGERDVTVMPGWRKTVGSQDKRSQ